MQNFNIKLGYTRTYIHREAVKNFIGDISPISGWGISPSQKSTFFRQNVKNAQHDLKGFFL